MNQFLVFLCAKFSQITFKWHLSSSAPNSPKLSTGWHLSIGDGSTESECPCKRILWWHKEEKQAYHFISSCAPNSSIQNLCDDIISLFSFLHKVGLTPHFMNADMLPGLQQGQEKMSKSDPSSSIFMEDEEVFSGFMHGEFKRSCNVS